MQESKTLSQDDLPAELFLANAVHEIRTPVQTIIGTLDLLSDTPLNKEQTEYVRQIRFGSTVLLTLVNDILDFSKIKSHKMTLENIPFDVKALTENTVHLLSIEAFNKNIEIVTDVDYNIPESVMGDPTRIQQVLINLIKNAIKFTEQGYIHIELSQKNEFLLFEVTDTGIGISKENAKKLFKLFDQGDASISRKYGGTGLGLYICRGLITNMDGKIGVKPNPFGGSCFWFKIPLKAAETPVLKQFELPVPATTKILIVDDSPMAANSLKKKLNAIGLQYIKQSTNGDDALLKMKYAEQLGNPFDIVFIDKVMPVMEGWHLASDIKNDPKLKKTKLYMLVPEGQMGQDAKMKLLDWFSGYLYKPIRLEKLDQLLIETNGAVPSIRLIEQIQNPAELKKQEEEKKAQEAKLAEGLKILVAEDHPVNRKILVEFLKKFGATIFEAENGQEAINIILKEKDINLIFMDIQMPVISGIDATKKLRTENYTGVIIACTANNDPANFVQYQKQGMNDILVKPFKKDDVHNMIDKWSTVLNLPSATQIAYVDTKMITNNELWDSADFEDTIGNDIDLGKQILMDYFDQTRHFLTAAHDLLENNDFEELHRIAHTLKGSSSAISANKLTNIAANLSAATKKKDTEDFRKNLDDFEEYFELLELATNKWRHLNPM